MLKGPSNTVEWLEVEPHCCDKEGVVKVWSDWGSKPDMDIPTGRLEMPRYWFSKVDVQSRDIVDLIDHLHLNVHSQNPHLVWRSWLLCASLIRNIYLYKKSRELTLGGVFIWLSLHVSIHLFVHLILIVLLSSLPSLFSSSSSSSSSSSLSFSCLACL